jgi:hypothetical protein
MLRSRREVARAPRRLAGLLESQARSLFFDRPRHRGGVRLPGLRAIKVPFFPFSSPIRLRMTRLLSEKEGFRLIKDKKRKGGPAPKGRKSTAKVP